jgi:hypothetical protein
MTNLFFGGEDVDFAPSGVSAITVSTSAGLFRSTYARCGIGITGQAVADPPSFLFAPPANWSASASSFWVHFQMCPTIAGPSVNNSTLANAQFLRLLDTAGVARLLIRGTGTNGQFKLSTRNAAGTITDLVTSAATAFPAGLAQVDVFVNYGTVGEFSVYINSALAAQYLGDITTNAGGQTFNNHQFAGWATASAPVCYISECLVDTADTRAQSLFLANSNTAGTNQAWTGTATNVNATTINDANFVYSPTAAQIQEYKPASLPAGAWAIVGVGMSARMLDGASGPTKADFVTRIASTEYLSADRTLTGSFTNYGNYLQTVNPATSSAWALADVAPTNMQYGLKSIT